MTTFRVYYARHEHMRDTLTRPETVTRASFLETHEPVALLHACRDAGDAYARMQGDSMPRAEADRVARLAGRTSMSVGDVLVRLDGTVLVCGRGATWHEHPPQDPISPGDHDA